MTSIKFYTFPAGRQGPGRPAIVLVSGLFSAFFVNNTMCLVLTPLVLEVALTLRRNPLPYLLAVAMASNVGSVATITGNPQNMMIGSLSGIDYRQFTAALAPVAIMGLLLTFAVIALLFPKEFRGRQRVELGELRVRVNRVLLWKTAVVSLGMIVFFFWGWPVAKIAIVAGVEKTSVETDLLAFASRFRLDRIAVLSTFSALLSNIVSNVPAVLVFRPIVPRLVDPQLGWLTLAMSSTLAGNLTVLGSVANLIVVQRARRDIHISFWDYCRVGIPLTVLSLAAGTAWLAWSR